MATKIFLTVGTQRFNFNRLLSAVDNLCAHNPEEFTCVAQIGRSSFAAKAMTTHAFMTDSEYSAAVAEADAVVTHAGTGSIMTALELGKATVVVPRLQRYGEHVDDHQLEIAKQLSDSGEVVWCHNVDTLADAIRHAQAAPRASCLASNTAFMQSIVSNLNRFADDLGKQRIDLSRVGLSPPNLS